MRGQATQPTIAAEAQPDFEIAATNHWDKTPPAIRYSLLAEQALLALKVCDPASGSGHFLIAAAHRLARHLARVRTGESEPAPEDHQHALRDVIGHCIYGVDINPMAVELCKVSLWMEAIEPGKPLSFLDHHIQCGNSLLGTTPALLKQGIPDDAFKPIEGDVKAVCSDLKKDNKRQRQEYKSGQGYLFDTPYKLGNLPASFAQLSSDEDESVTDVTAKERRYAELVHGADYLNARLLADTWCAAFVWQKDKSDLGRLCPTERDFRNIENNPHSILPCVKSEVRRLADQYQFFHWHLAFPDVFRPSREVATPENEKSGWNAGFDVVLGNPPWERIQVEEKQFFAASRPDIAKARKRERTKLIAALESEDAGLFAAWNAARRSGLGQTHLIKDSGTFPLSGTGNVNTFATFVECGLDRTSRSGRFGMVIPSGLLTEASYQQMFQHWLDNDLLISGFDFENRRELFPTVHSSFRFALLTLSGGTRDGEAISFAFQLHGVSDIKDPSRLVRLTADDIATINPRSRTVPPVPDKRAADILLRFHRQFGIFLTKNADENPWDADSKQMINTSHDSSDFVEPTDAIVAAIRHNGTSSDDATPLLRLYDGKMIDQFNHRLASVVYRSGSTFRTSGSEATTDEQYGEATYIVLPQYWIRSERVGRVVPETCHKRGWLIAYREVTASTNWRTVISTIVPRSGLLHTAPTIYSSHPARLQACLVANMNAFALDYAARLKISGTHLSHFLLHQLPMLLPESFDQTQPAWLFGTTAADWIYPRVLELTYTAWDLESFALDCGYDGPPFRWDEERRFLLRCELDAAYFHLYLGPPAEWGTDSPQLREMFPTPRHAVDYIMETFPIVKRKDERAHGEYRTKRVILEIYDEMAEAIRTGQPYQTRLNPPPGPPTDAEGNFIPMAQWDKNNWPPHIHPPRKAEAEIVNE